MKIFIQRILLFSMLFSGSIIMIFMKADGTTDPFYIRFTTPKQESLIIGTSRAAQGLQPHILNRILNTNFSNYAFTVGHSPYGEAYYKSIKRKLKKETSSGIFILTIDPWSISSRTKNPNDSLNFREINLCVGNTPFVNLNPNIFYLLNNFKGDYTKVLSNNNGNYMFLHQSGWLEVSVSMDSSAVHKRTKAKIEHYKKNNLPFYKFSTLRLNYLKETIKYLKSHGEVYIVRLPVHPEMMKIENVLLPNFEKVIEEIADSTNGYLNMTINNDDFKYTDGNHLHKESGKIVSEKIAIWIDKKRTHNTK